MGPGEDQRVGYYLFAPVALGAFQNHSFSDVLWHLHCACSVPRCGLHINVCRQEGVQPACSHVGKSSMFFFSFSVVLINPQQSPETAIFPHIGAPSGGTCKDQATWILNPAKLSGFAEGRHIEVTINNVNAIQRFP